ncbi:MAG: hypothetical protein HS126_40420 [Anaerolineales bacterium]|nr:hypothetical protein [Anaerolineales bacterium]
MILKTLEVSLSKEERRIVDEHGNSASTWARIGFTVELEEGDLPDLCIKQIKGEIQPQIDEWLLNQGGLILPPGQAGDEYAPHAGIPELGEHGLIDVFEGVEIELSEVPDLPAADAETDEIPL